MPPELLRVFSKRADAIDGEVERLQAEGRVRTPRLVKWAVHTTRQATTDPAAGDDSATTDEAVVTGVFDRLAGAQGSTAQASTFPYLSHVHPVRPPASAVTSL